MSVNKPIGDNARKDAVRKRSQLTLIASPWSSLSSVVSREKSIDPEF
jgi:hypothetical protein